MNYMAAPGTERINLTGIDLVYYCCFKVTGITKDRQLERNKSWDVVWSRWISWYLMRKYLKFTLQQMADNSPYNHTSVCHGFRAIKNDMDILQKHGKKSYLIKSLNEAEAYYNLLISQNHDSSL